MISVIIPVYNEEDAIIKTIDNIKKVLKENKLLRGSEIIVVNDGSSDNTRNNAIETGVIVLDNETNTGYGYSLKKGIEYAKNDIIVITDADLTYPFEEVPEMLRIKNKGYDMVVGARTGEYYKESVLKSILRKILKIFTEFMAGTKINDVNSGLRIFNKNDVKKFLPRLCNTFSFTTSQTLAYLMNGYSIYYMDIPYYKRVGKTKVKLFKNSLITAKYVLLSGFYYNPKKIFTLIMILCIIILLIILLIIFCRSIL